MQRFISLGWYFNKINCAFSLVNSWFREKGLMYTHCIIIQQMNKQKKNNTNLVYEIRQA